MVCFRPKLYEPSYCRQNLYIQRYIFGHKCIFKTKGLIILSAHRTQIFTECLTPYRGITFWAWWHVSDGTALHLSTQYPKFRSRPSTQPLGHAADIPCNAFIFCWLKSRKRMSLNCLFLKYNCVISLLALKTIQIDILYMFLCSLFKKLWWNRWYLGNTAAILDLVNFHRFKS